MNSQDTMAEQWETPRTHQRRPQETPHHFSPGAPPSNGRLHHEPQGTLAQQASPIASLSPQPTVVPAKPSPKSLSASSPEIYGPDRLLPSATPQLPGGPADAASIAPSSTVRFDEAQLAMFAADNAARMGNSLKDELTIAAGKVTPGVDDTPYIQYALEALTRDRRSGSTQHVSAPTSGRQPYLSDIPRRIPDEELAFAAVTQPQPVYYSHNVKEQRHAGEPRVGQNLARVAPTAPPAEPPSPPTSSLDDYPPTSDQWIAVDKLALQAIDPRGRTYPPLTYKPRILRPFSMIILMISCLLMIAALIFSDRFSAQRVGLTPYPGTIYSGQYFVFRILPQLLGAVILIYAQSIVTASLRILPFTTMAKEDPRERYLALFQNLYPTSFLRPQLAGPWQLMVFDLATWVAIFTVPLQSVAFTCVYVGNEWIWTPSTGVVWALVGLYAFLLVATNLLMAFWFKQWTGLRWDIRSIADLIPLVNRTNTLSSYKQRALSGPGGNFKARLNDRWFDRLGYWQTEDTLSGGIWHSIGTSAASPANGPEVHDERGKRGSFDASIGSHDLPSLGMGSGGYLHGACETHP